ncbi:MAG: hypothetical protein MR502_01945 [Bacteroides sp.]|nr:hypothetical protein [Bacteroides sp.]
MDIDLLSKIVKELILDNDEVALPGIGSFIAEIVPSVFSDKGYTINPPYRRLSFRQKGSGDENMVIDFYARCNNIDTPTASRIIREFLEEMRRVLETKKSIVFPGLGKLRATKENYFFFVADEDLDIYPEGFGLEPISLKTHEETPAEVSATMAVLRSILNPEEAETATAETAKAEEVNRPEETTTAPAEANQEEAKVNAADAKMEEDGTNASETETQTTNTEEAAPAEANAEEAEANVNEPAEVNAPAEQTEDNATPAGDNPVNVNDLAANAETVDNAGPAENTESEPAEVPMTDNKSGATMPATTTTSTATTIRTTSRKPAGSKTWQAIKWTVIILVILAVTALLTFIILAHIAPDFIDSILYTPEELEILNL